MAVLGGAAACRRVKIALLPIPSFTRRLAVSAITSINFDLGSYLIPDKNIRVRAGISYIGCVER
jgi:hypothetical protein